MRRKAREKVNPLRSPIPALQFLVRFVYLDLDRARVADAALVELQQFVERDEHIRPERAVPAAKVKELQQGALRVLATLARKGTTTAVQGPLRLTYVALSRDDQVRVTLRGSVGDVFYYQIARVLQAAGANRLRTCPAEDCGRLFVKVTKKAYCSTRCQSRIYMRHRREAERRADREALARVQREDRHGKSTRAR